MRNKIVVLNNNKIEVRLHCARVFEVMDNRVVLEMDNKRQTDNLWWHMENVDRFGGEYEYRPDDKRVIWIVSQEIITAMYNY